ncbi:MAG: FAD-binding oxidoreductase [Paracoccaceae bacterium]|jgi:FAD/FMN-containing dehydrogenase|nr:FAD-binding oxidoreductase [Paracoccaceae bacterium]
MLNPADDAFATHLRTTIGADILRPLAPHYLQEPRGHWQGVAGLVAAPRSAADLAQVVRICAEARVGVVPFGGGTGLVGGQVLPVGPAPVIVSMERMRAIRAVYAVENVLVAEAGATLAEVQAAAAGADRLFALSLASEGTAQIGGNLATNAGGVQVLRYGNARDLCLGLEVVLANGTIWHGLKRLRKDNTGYDLRHLMIGSEGTLGLITAASLRLHPRPAQTGAALFCVPNPQAALDLLGLAQTQMGGAISAFELMHGMGLKFLAETMPQIRQPFAAPPEWMVLIDLGTGQGTPPETLLETLAVDAMARGLITDGVIAASTGQRQEFWAVRESIPLANRAVGAIASHDISLPLREIPGFIQRAGQALAGFGGFRINCFGHLGDGNLHYNIFPEPGVARGAFANVAADLTRCVHDIVHELGGSVSAEHGIGRLKSDDLARYSDPVKLSAMRAIKAALDPVGILNPGAVVSGAALSQA